MTEQSSGYVDFLLAEFRCGVLRGRLAVNEITAMGVALRNGLVGPNEAIQHLSDCGALWLIGTEITAPSTA